LGRKELVDHADIRRLLLMFPELKALEGAVADCLRDRGASGEALEAWHAISEEEIAPENDRTGTDGLTWWFMQPRDSRRKQTEEFFGTPDLDSAGMVEVQRM
jgi:hypothetical protein